MSKFRVLIEGRPFCVFDQTAMVQLKNPGIEVIDMRGSGVENTDFMETMKSVDAVISGNELHITDELLRKVPNLKIVAKLGTGLDMIDIDAASRHNVLVFHTPGINTQAVADHTFALILSTARKIIICDQSLREKQWEHTKIMGIEIWQKTLGIIGLGAIGRNVALRAKGFQMKVKAYDPYWPGEFAKEHGVEQVEMDELLRISDIVTLHLPLTSETRGLIDKKALDKMKPSAILINAARGGIVNESDLYHALKNKKITGAGIDVFENEPPTASPLLELDNVVLTPHTAAFTLDVMNKMSMGVVEQLIEYYNGTIPKNAVNPGVYDNIKLEKKAAG